MQGKHTKKHLPLTAFNYWTTLIFALITRSVWIMKRLFGLPERLFYSNGLWKMLKIYVEMSIMCNISQRSCEKNVHPIFKCSMWPRIETQYIPCSWHFMLVLLYVGPFIQQSMVWQFKQPQTHIHTHNSWHFICQIEIHGIIFYQNKEIFHFPLSNFHKFIRLKRSKTNVSRCFFRERIVCGCVCVSKDGPNWCEENITHKIACNRDFFFHRNCFWDCDEVGEKDMLTKCFCDWQTMAIMNICYNGFVLLHGNWAMEFMFFHFSFFIFIYISIDRIWLIGRDVATGVHWQLNSCVWGI